MAATSTRLDFSSPAGQAIVRDVLRSRLPFEPHHYQVEGVCKSLDGIDLLAILPTGGGKTGFYYMYMIVLLALQDDQDLRRRFKRQHPQDPAIILVLPTNGLEEEMALTFAKFGLKAVAINSDTLYAARQRDEDLWCSVRQKVSVIILGPEQLRTKGFESLVRAKEFSSRSCALGIDEVHLVNSWGQGFRKSFTQIGFARARMNMRTKTQITTKKLIYLLVH